MRLEELGTESCQIGIAKLKNKTITGVKNK